MPYSSMSRATVEKKEPCSACKAKPSEVTCQCGQQFDFSCLMRHHEQVNAEYKAHHKTTGDQLRHLYDSRNKSSGDSARAAINLWKRQWIDRIHEIAREAELHVQDNQSSPNPASQLMDDFNSLEGESQLTVHDKLSIILDLSKQVKEASELPAGDSSSDDYKSRLDAELQKRFDSSGASAFFSSRRDDLHNSHRTEHTASPSTPVLRLQTPLAELPTRPQTSMVEAPMLFKAAVDEQPARPETPPLEPFVHAPASPEKSPVRPPSPPPSPTPRQTSPFELVSGHISNPPSSPSSSSSTMVVDPLQVPTAATASATALEPAAPDDDFDLGLTSKIDRYNAINIEANNDRFAGTVCCHENELVFVDYDEIARKSVIVYIPDIHQPTVRTQIRLDGTTTMDAQEDDWIRDIIYSKKTNNYIFLKRTSLQQFNDGRTALELFHSLPHSTLTRITHDNNYLYLAASAARMSASGDQIHLLNHDKETIAQKTFREIVPNGRNRGGVLIGEIIDIAAGNNDGQLAMTYRVDRRREIGICVFSIKNNGRDWSGVKQLFLNECWNERITHTPRIDWSPQLNTFILVEYLTGHLLLITKDTEVVGECRYVYGDQQHGSHPINISTPSNGLLCTRYETVINIRQIK